MSTAQEPDMKKMGEQSLLEVMGDGECVEMDSERGFAAVEFTCRPEFCHSGGVAQGGYVSGWIDSAMAHAVIARFGMEYWIASLELKVSFFRPAGPGRVRAEGWIERAGRQTLFTEGQLLDTEGRVLAKATSTIRLIEQKH